MAEPLRFVVLHHTGIEDPHFDLMFETSNESQLVTFRLPQWPLHENQPAIKLRDHRRAYLTLQGDISMGRGRVDRLDEGEIQVSQIALGWDLRIGERFHLQFEPDRGGSPESWWVRVLEK
jgi:hypothetical protein